MASRHSNLNHICNLFQILYQNDPITTTAAKERTSERGCDLNLKELNTCCGS